MEKYNPKTPMMTKKLTGIATFLIFFLFLSPTLHSQEAKEPDTYVSDNANIHFFASTVMEDIEATSKAGVCALNTKTKKISAKVAMTSFEFRRKKMQEDFDEDYAESAKYPYAILNATIVENINLTKDGTYDVTLKGTFEMHGVKQDREIKGKLTIKNGHPASATAQFEVKLVDHKIKVPTIVVMKIAEVVKVNVDLTFKKYQ
ncbi:MAG: hypothetical protein JWO03_1509 [Bacteroidetes bacterium]|nr:hypothetical protein [Bacteroidota bacterium]